MKTKKCRVCGEELPRSEFSTQYANMAARFGEASLYETFDDREISAMMLALSPRCKACHANRLEFEAIAAAEENANYEGAQ